MEKKWLEVPCSKEQSLEADEIWIKSCEHKTGAEIEAELEAIEIQELVNEYIESVNDWSKKNETKTLIMSCAPDLVDNMKLALSKDYTFELSYDTYYGFTTAKFEVQRKQ